MDFFGMEVEKTTLLYRFIISGGVMMFALIPLSIFSLGFIIQSYIRLRRSRIAPKHLVVQAGDVSSKQDLEEFRQKLEENGSPLARASLAMIRAAGRGEPATPEENPVPLDDELDRLYHSLTPLAVSYTIAPLVGLLGTILGLMSTFYQYAVVRNQDIEVLSVGINEALVTTMWGLGIAIPVYVFTAMLRGIIFRYEKDVMPGAVAEIMKSCEAPARAGAAATAARD